MKISKFRENGCKLRLNFINCFMRLLTWYLLPINNTRKSSLADLGYETNQHKVCLKCSKIIRVFAEAYKCYYCVDLGVHLVKQLTIYSK